MGVGHASRNGIEGMSSQLFDVIEAAEGRELVDRLREIGLDQYIELPQIAVMGDTSSGKSSLLSALSGVSFPSSDQLTTRCPTQLILSQAGTFEGKMALHRFHANERELHDEIRSMDEVPMAIARLTKLLIDEGQYISDDQIVIELCGPHLPNLTLTDLPGLVRTVGDHEDRSIIARVREMVNRFMKQERTIIIAVVPANVDMHNTEILQAAQEADPEGTRTIAVVTKVDLVDAGAERAVHDLLLNKKKHMRLGYHAVKCRSQKDVNDSMSIKDGVHRERAFFGDHEYWRRLPTHLWGIQRLSKRLSLILQDNIRSTLPSVLQEIDERITRVRGELSSMGTEMDSSGVRRQAFSQWVNTYLRHMAAAMRGEYEMLPENSPGSSGTDVRLRAMLRQKDALFQSAIEATKTRMLGIANEEQGKDKEDEDEDQGTASERVYVGDYVTISIDDQERVAQVCKTRMGGDVQCRELPEEWLGPTRWKKHARNVLFRFIAENRGDELAIFPSYRVFCNIFRQLVDQWVTPTRTLVTQYCAQTQLVSDRIVQELHAFTRVERFLQDRVKSILQGVNDEAGLEMNKLLEGERRPYTQDPELFRQMDDLRRQTLEARIGKTLTVDDHGRVALASVMKALESLTLGNHEREAFEMEIALRAYVEVAIARFVDLVPMRLHELVLATFLRELEKQLLGETDETLARLLEDSPHMQEKRAELKAEIECLREAKREIELMF